jgi:hypothetical protein
MIGITSWPQTGSERKEVIAHAMRKALRNACRLNIESSFRRKLDRSDFIVAE